METETLLCVLRLQAKGLGAMSTQEETNESDGFFGPKDGGKKTAASQSLSDTALPPMNNIAMAPPAAKQGGAQVTSVGGSSGVA